MMEFSPAIIGSVSITSLSDDKAGNLLGAFLAANGNSNVLGSGASVTFTVSQALPLANAGASYTNVVTVESVADEGNPRSDSVSGTVSYADVRPRLALSKAVSPASLSEGGVGVHSATYTTPLPNTTPSYTDPVSLNRHSFPTRRSSDLAFLAANGNSNVLGSGASVTFTVSQALPLANAGASYTNVVTVESVADEGNPRSDSVSGTVSYADVRPRLALSKAVSPASLSEGGVGVHSATYTTPLPNTTPSYTDPVSLNRHSFPTRRSSDLAFRAANGNSNVLGSGASVTFTVSQALPLANAGASYTNVVTVHGGDDECNPTSDSASATASYADVRPRLALSKAVSPASLSEGGVGVQSVTYTYTVTNTSPASTDPVTIPSLPSVPTRRSSDLFRAANGNSNVLGSGASVTFTVSQALPLANAGASYTNVVTVQGVDDESNATKIGAGAWRGCADVRPRRALSKAVSPASLSEGGVG